MSHRCSSPESLVLFTTLRYVVIIKPSEVILYHQQGGREAVDIQATRMSAH